MIEAGRVKYSSLPGIQRQTVISIGCAQQGIRSSFSSVHEEQQWAIKFSVAMLQVGIITTIKSVKNPNLPESHILLELEHQTTRLRRKKNS